MACARAQLIGLAIYNTVLLDLNFPMVVYRKLVGQKPTLRCGSGTVFCPGVVGVSTSAAERVFLPALCGCEQLLLIVMTASGCGVMVKDYGHLSPMM